MSKIREFKVADGRAFELGDWEVIVYPNGYALERGDLSTDDFHCSVYFGKDAEEFDRLIFRDAWVLLLHRINRLFPTALELPGPLMRRVAAHVRKHYVWSE